MEIRKGILFTLDGLFAAILIVSGLILVFSNYIQEKDYPQIEYYSKDIADCLANIKISELNNTYIQGLIANGTITHPDNSIIDQIGESYVLNQTVLAENITKTVMSELIPSNLGFSILIENNTIFGRNTSDKDELISYRKLISGLEKSKPIRGATSKVYLEGFNEKTYSSYKYFGGFVGQGNITVFIDDVPAGVEMTGLDLEIDGGSAFQISINGNICNSSLYPNTGHMNADSWNISYCLPDFIPGTKNEFTFEFLGDISDSYIGGGFIKATYLTDQMMTAASDTNKKYWLPQIEGIVNLYSSIYIPGSLDEMQIYLDFLANATNNSNKMYMSIGNTTVLLIEELNGADTIILSDENLSAVLNYSKLDLKTVPIRIGFENVSFGYIYDGNADVAIATDLSGSMAWRMTSSYNGVMRNCDDPDLDNSNTARISIAKCLDIQFAEDILNISGNKIGLISYNESTCSEENLEPTTEISNITSIIGISVPESGYHAVGATCICCGINSARDILTDNITITSLIPKGSDWLYNNFSLSVEPETDVSGNEWNDLTYANESDWHFGTAILGATNGYDYPDSVDTEIGSELSGSAIYANLWEDHDDTPGAPNDFTSDDLNYTGNSYGISGADDGWDWDNQDNSGPYGYDDNVDYNEATGGKIELDMGTGGSPENRCSSYDCSGGYGILVNITEEMYEIISGNGHAQVSFYYEWDDLSGNNFDWSDEVWVKARWTTPTEMHYLGSELSNQGSDSTYEIDYEDNPNTDFSGTYSQDITEWIDSEGIYYLDLGGKIYSTWSFSDCGGWFCSDNLQRHEWGYFRFDNIQIKVDNSTDHYYFRKHFNITDINTVQRGVLNVYSDDNAKIYLNGVLIDDDPDIHEAEYWNRKGISVNGDLFNEGDNVIAVKLSNADSAAKFDLKLTGLDDPREKAMLVMTDGEANRQCTEQGTGDSKQDAIQASCDAKEEYGITVYAVGYSSSADEVTLEAIAECGGGIYTKSDNVTALQEFYQDVASSIVAVSRHAQTIEVEGELESSTLYGTSYVEINYTPFEEDPVFGEISLVMEEKNFKNCSFNVSINENIRVVDSKLTSYSSEHWTDELIVNDVVVYNLSENSEDYTMLGDPFIINIPAYLIHNGTNSFSIRTGDSPENSTACSLNNSFIYTGNVPSSVAYSDVLEKAEGCMWNIEFDAGNNVTVSVPPDYSGTKICNYTASARSGATAQYDTTDTYDDAVYRLLDNLDYDDDGRIFIDLDEQHLVVGAISVGRIPYPWGPAIAEIRVWK